MDTLGGCYVCKKEPAKRCTKCYQIAYCGVPCQRSDWKYHRMSCTQKSVNVIDSLINLRNFEHILLKICSYLSGADLHYFGCVKRTWRDLIMRIRGSVIERKLWRHKLADQWKKGGAQIREIQEYDSAVSAMKVSGSELFIDVYWKSEIDVYDITTCRLKFTLPAAKGQNSAWDVHDDFLLIFDGNRFYIFDRRKNVREDIDDSVCMQIGTHYKNHKDKNYVDDGFGVEYVNKHPSIKDPRKDAPAKINIFKEPGGRFDDRISTIVVVYKSGIVSRWNYFTPYETYYNEFEVFERVKNVTYDKFTFKRVASCNDLTVHAGNTCLIRPRHLLLQPVYCNGDEPWEKISKVFFFDGEAVDVCELERYQNNVDQIDGVDELFDYFESSTLGVDVSRAIDQGDSYEGYLILKRKFDFVDEELEERKQFIKAFWYRGDRQNIPEGHPQTYEEWEKTLPITEDDDCSTVSMLEVHFIPVLNSCMDEIMLRRRMRIEGNLMNATMNENHMAVAFQDILFNNRIHIYNAKEIIADEDHCDDEGIEYVDNPVPIQSINLGRMNLPCQVLLAGPNRILWTESIDDPYEERFPVKCANFWMA